MGFEVFRRVSLGLEWFRGLGLGLGLEGIEMFRAVKMALHGFTGD